MTQEHITTSSSPSLALRMLIGGAIGLAIISLFIFGFNGYDPSWGPYWRVRPLIITPLAGAAGGACNYFITKYSRLAGLNKFFAVALSLIIFLVGLWLGIILGLDGTLWD